MAAQAKAAAPFWAGYSFSISGNGRPVVTLIFSGKSPKEALIKWRNEN
jgi:hypothetical protein